MNSCRANPASVITAASSVSHMLNNISKVDPVFFRYRSRTSMDTDILIRENFSRIQVCVRKKCNLTIYAYLTLNLDLTFVF